MFRVHTKVAKRSAGCLNKQLNKSFDSNVKQKILDSKLNQKINPKQNHHNQSKYSFSTTNPSRHGSNYNQGQQRGPNNGVQGQNDFVLVENQGSNGQNNQQSRQSTVKPNKSTLFPGMRNGAPQETSMNSNVEAQRTNIHNMNQNNNNNNNQKNQYMNTNSNNNFNNNQQNQYMNTNTTTNNTTAPNHSDNLTKIVGVVGTGAVGAAATNHSSSKKESDSVNKTSSFSNFSNFSNFDSKKDSIAGGKKNTDIAISGKKEGSVAKPDQSLDLAGALLTLGTDLAKEQIQPGGIIFNFFNDKKDDKKDDKNNEKGDIHNLLKTDEKNFDLKKNNQIITKENNNNNNNNNNVPVVSDKTKTLPALSSDLSKEIDIAKQVKDIIDHRSDEKDDDDDYLQDLDPHKIMDINEVIKMPKLNHIQKLYKLVQNDPFLGPIHHVLHKKSPSFPVSSKHTKVIETPTEFYNDLVENIKNAKHRICLSALYLGSDDRELKLVNAVDEALSKNPQLHVLTLFDKHRGQRIDKSGNGSYRFFEQLSQKYPGRVCSALYVPPCLLSPDAVQAVDELGLDQYHVEEGIVTKLGRNFRHFLRETVKGRAKELFSVHHMKAYIIDDVSIISGANLSDIYFTNRQDRYLSIKNRELSDYLSAIVQTMSFGNDTTTQHSFYDVDTSEQRVGNDIFDIKKSKNKNGKNEPKNEQKNEQGEEEDGLNGIIQVPKPTFIDNPNNEWFNIGPFKTYNENELDQIKALHTLVDPNITDYFNKRRYHRLFGQGITKSQDINNDCQLPNPPEPFVYQYHDKIATKAIKNIIPTNFNYQIPAQISQKNKEEFESLDMIIYPSLQIPSFGMRHDELVMMNALDAISDATMPEGSMDVVNQNDDQKMQEELVKNKKMKYITNIDSNTPRSTALGLNMYMLTGYFNISKVFSDAIGNIAKKYETYTKNHFDFSEFYQSEVWSPMKQNIENDNSKKNDIDGDGNNNNGDNDVTNKNTPASSSSSSSSPITPNTKNQYITQALGDPLRVGYKLPRLRSILVAASEEANGWWNAGGLPGLVPDIYKTIIDNFNDYSNFMWNTNLDKLHGVKIKSTKLKSIVAVHALEYTRENWSYHAKGLFLQPLQYQHFADDVATMGRYVRNSYGVNQNVDDNKNRQGDFHLATEFIDPQDIVNNTSGYLYQEYLSEYHRIKNKIEHSNDDDNTMVDGVDNNTTSALSAFKYGNYRKLYGDINKDLMQNSTIDQQKEFNLELYMKENGYTYDIIPTNDVKSTNGVKQANGDVKNDEIEKGEIVIKKSTTTPVCLISSTKPLWTTLGSSNYGYRSLKLDSELQLSMLIPSQAHREILFSSNLPLESDDAKDLNVLEKENFQNGNGMKKIDGNSASASSHGGSSSTTKNDTTNSSNNNNDVDIIARMNTDLGNSVYHSESKDQRFVHPLAYILKPIVKYFL